MALASCASPSSPRISLNSSDPQRPLVEITGVSSRDLGTFSAARLSPDEWADVLRVSVRGARDGQPPVSGRYDVAGAVRFVPLFPFDPGREYDVVFDPARLSRVALPRLARMVATISVPGEPKVPSTVVEAVYPSADRVPENLLRMYIQFSAPMGQQGGTDHVVLLDRNGAELKGALLPLDTELWNGERTRFTVLFDPGRVKRGILPNREMGRPLRAGDAFTLVVRTSWVDGRGVPLKTEFRREFRVGPADERPLDISTWRVAVPAAGGREAVVVTFPESLDHGLLQRTLAVKRADAAVEGEARVETGETRWTFVPNAPWTAGDHTIVILPVLEDPTGNRIGRSFETLSSAPERTEPFVLPFSVR